ASIGILSIDVSNPNPLRPDYVRTMTSFNWNADSPSLGTRMISSTYLGQSSQDIGTIIEPSIHDNNLISLVVSFRHFLARLQSSPPEN
ncbi:hypothetical protein PSTT_15080, partial [Puccinia striiformis]